jgi:hypothetical protein
MYRAFVKRTIGWSMAEIMDMDWGEFCLEVFEARRIEGMD